MRMALRKAGVRPEQIDYINAHGTSTPINDPTETLAVKTVFGDHAKKLVMSSTKSMTGHLLGAAGGLEAGIRAGRATPGRAADVNLDNPDPACDLDYAAHVKRPMRIRYALSNSFGFGGTNGTLLLKEYETLRSRSQKPEGTWKDTSLEVRAYFWLLASKFELDRFL
jgi:3-oxoacyl-[acyl-carrier-protein] synthase II